MDGLLSWDQTRTEHAVAELERSGLAVADGVSIRIAHDLIRSSTEAQLPPALRRELHALIGGWLEKQVGDDVQLMLEALIHRREAGLDVSDLALRVLQSPRRRLLGREGLRELSQVADSLGFSGPMAAILHERVALLASELGEHRIAMERWMELATNASDPALAASCYLGASRAASRIVQRREEALPLLARAQNQATADPVVQVEIAAHHANLLRVLEHRMDDARRIAEEAVLAGRGLWARRDGIETSARERDAYVMALQAAYDAAVIEEDAAGMMRTSEEMTQVAQGSEEAALTAALNLSMALWFAGRIDEGVDRARYAWVQSHERMLPMLILDAGSGLASRLIDLGALDEAEEVISECVELERRIVGEGARLAIGKVATRSIHELRHLAWLSRGIGGTP
jgi:tetratricopeptide (TPR) repeat protein